MSAAAGVDYADDGRVLALSDWDYDGDVDLWIANRSGPQVRYLRNNHGHQANRISFKLTGVNCNRDAIGAKIILRWSENPQLVMTHTVRSSDGYLSQSSPWVHFGLGYKTSVDTVEVVWPNGNKQAFSNVSANMWLKLTEDDPSFEEWHPPSFPPLTEDRFESQPISDRARIVLLTPIPLPELRYQNGNGSTESLSSGIERARLLNLWATWCEPCLHELAQWSEKSQLIANSGIEVVAVNADERDANDPQASIKHAQAVAEKLQIPFAIRFADAALTERLDAIQRALLSRQRPLPLPSSFLVDKQGRLRIVYKGPVDADTLLQDAKLIEANADEVLRSAMPFAGRWLSRPGGSSPLQIAVKLIEGDYQDDAARYIQSIVDNPESDEEFRSASLLNLLGALALDQKQFQEAAEAFDKSLKLEPHNRTAHIELGTLLLGIHRGAAAEKHFRYVLKATPDDPEQNYKLGIALLQQDKLQDAGRQMQKVLKLRSDPMAHWQIAEILLKLGRIDRSIQSYERAIQLRPELSKSANNLAWILATVDDDQLRNATRAIELAEGICASASAPDANQLDTLAAAYAAGRDFEKAVRTANLAIEAAKQQQNDDLAAEIRSRLDLYRKRKPFRESL